MSERDLFLLFTQLAAMLAVALVCGQIARFLRQPAVLGELLGGILLGPTILGHLAPGLFAHLFPPDGTIRLARDAILQLGMLFFLFAAGLEVNLGHIRANGRRVVLSSTFGILVPFGLGCGVVLAWPEIWARQPGAGTLGLAAFIGVALSISALPVIARILLDLHLLGEETGTVIIAAATINDLVGWSLFAIVLGLFSSSDAPGSELLRSGLALVFALLVVVGGRFFGPTLLNRIQRSTSGPASLIGVTAAIVLTVAALGEVVGIHAVFGAFLAGVALGGNPEAETVQQAHDMVYQFAVSFFAPLYFVSIGLSTDFLAQFNLPLSLLVLAIAFAGKLIGAGGGAWLAGMRPRAALAVGFGLNARGAMEVILASVAFEARIIDQELLVALILMALITSLISAPALQRLAGGRRA